MQLSLNDHETLNRHEVSNRSELTAKGIDNVRVTRIGKAIKAMIAEYNLALMHNLPLNNTYEGWAVLKQKLDELWEEVKLGETGPSRDVLRKEAAELGAATMRFIVDLTAEESHRKETPL